jgi:hypothetical protein
MYYMTASDWLLLVTNLPGRKQTLRMRVWRALRAAGAGMLRDGVYLLPTSGPARRLLDEKAAEIQEGGGSAQVLSLASERRQQAAFEALFDRSAEYAALLQRVAAFRRSLRKIAEPEARRQLAALKRDGASLGAIDFFPSDGKDALEQSLAAVEQDFTAKFSPDEPHAAQQEISRRTVRDYRGRLWGTRQRLWVDRVCSAWLIRRFIDARASFVWLAAPSDLPRGAVGFDYDGAEFTHVGDLVTFEVLLASFGLDRDEALQRIGTLVHGLDVGGLSAPEAPAFPAILAGARSKAADDDALIKVMFPILDLLYAGCGSAQAQNDATSPRKAPKRPSKVSRKGQ